MRRSRSSRRRTPRATWSSSALVDLGTFSRLLLGSVARKVLLHTAASVLGVRGPHATAGVRAPAASVTGLAF